MTVKQFELMDIDQQVKAIGKFGEFLAEREDDFFYYRLYIINNFFVEERNQKTENTNQTQSVFVAGPGILPYIKRNNSNGL